MTDNGTSNGHGSSNGSRSSRRDADQYSDITNVSNRTNQKMVEQALRQGWPVPQHLRVRLVESVDKEHQSGEMPTNVATDLLLKMDRVNIEREKIDQGMAEGGTIVFNMVTARPPALEEPDDG